MTLSTRKKQILNLLEDPKTYNELEAELGISASTCRNHINQLIDSGYPIDSNAEGGQKVWYLRNEEGEHPVNPDVPTGELRSKAAITKDAKETVHALIQHFDQDLTGRAPAAPDEGLTVRESNEDMVVHRSDDHIGASYHDEFGNDTFSAEIGIERVRTISERVFNLKQRHEAAGVDFDTLHVVLGGDHVHGVGIHADQPWETELSLPEQLNVASDLYMEFIDRAQQEFESVQVVCQKGNHGELRGVCQTLCSVGRSSLSACHDIRFGSIDDSVARRSPKAGRRIETVS